MTPTTSTPTPSTLTPSTSETSPDPATEVAILEGGGPGYDRARPAWNLAIDQRPTAVATPRDATELAAALRWAAAAGLRAAAQGTGHNAAALGPLDDTLLVRTDALRRVTIVPAARMARVEAGAVWSDVVGPAAEHGLIPLAGSAHDVGVVGYSLGGGVRWLARRCGLAADAILAAEVVTADGRLRRVDDAHDPDLFWALRGGGGDFAAVTALEIRLHPLTPMSAGVLFFAHERAGEVLRAWRDWVPDQPDEMTSCGRLLQFPPLPELPDELRGRSFTAIEIVHLGAPTETAALVAPLRALGPDADTIAPAGPADVLELHMDPPGPVPFAGDGMVLDALPDAALTGLLAAAGPGSGSSLLSVELRALGGALGRRTAGAGALGALEGEFLFYAAGMTPDAGTATTVAREVRRVLDAVGPWRAPRDYLNFRDTREHPGRFFDEPTLARLRAVKDTYDPTGLFRSNHPITTGARR